MIVGDKVMPLSSTLADPAGFTIRQAGGTDVAALTELNGYVQSIHVTHVPDVFVEPVPSDIARWFSDRLLIPDSRAWLAEAGSVAAGYLLLIYQLRPGTPFSRERRFAEIDQIGVHPAYRGRGIGRALVETALEDVRSTGVESVVLSSWAFNSEAAEFFQQCGFVPVVTKWQRQV